MKLFSQLFRYASRNFITSFMVAFTCLFSIILLFDFAEIERRTSAKEISFFMKLNMIFLRAPHFAEQVLPFIVFIAAIFVFWRMNRSNELIIFRSSGISLWRLILPISLTALLIGFVDVRLSSGRLVQVGTDRLGDPAANGLDHFRILACRAT